MKARELIKLLEKEPGREVYVREDHSHPEGFYPADYTCLLLNGKLIIESNYKPKK